MELTESQIYEGLGLEQPQVQQEEPAPNDPVEQTENHESVSVESQGVENRQEPQQESREGAFGEEQPQQEQTQTVQDQEQTTKPGEMSLEQRRENAARRRREETQAAINQAVTQERERRDKEIQSFFAEAGLKNTVTGAPITNMEEYRAWKQEYDQAKMQQDLQEGKLTVDGIGKLIAQNPTIQKAAEIIRESEEKAAQAQAEADRVKLEGELAQIRQFNPNIQTVQDLLTMPRAKEFYQLVKRGNTFVDAYKLAHYDELTQQTAAAARQQAQNLARSKSHLTSGTQQGAGAVTVPRSEMAMFRAFNPNASEAEIQAYYNKYQGGN